MSHNDTQNRLRLSTAETRVSLNTWLLLFVYVDNIILYVDNITVYVDNIIQNQLYTNQSVSN